MMKDTTKITLALSSVKKIKTSPIIDYNAFLTSILENDYGLDYDFDCNFSAGSFNV
ncbi:hypothetical protein [Helicobacter sp. 13S00401-1]|uniref:hypothetical protein n=1 Tax=Helicobacter sp. 13S00401-1 TaxID=1905758 RepID=UPI001556D2B0|nr:hypothetical protein [Helicobacter sp. 13S00401-1]